MKWLPGDPVDLMASASGPAFYDFVAQDPQAGVQVPTGSDVVVEIVVTPQE